MSRNSDMTRAGRRRSVVWACFEDHPAAQGKRRVLCRFCQHDTVANPERMVRHIVRSCPNVDEQHKQICRDYRAQTVPGRRRPRRNGNGNAPTTGSARPRLYAARHASYASSARRIGALETSGAAGQAQHQMLLGLDPAEAQLARDELVLSVVTTKRVAGPPWGLLGNEHLRRALRRLQPEFEPPSAAEARRDILPRLYQQTQREVDAFLQSATSLTVVCSTQAAAGHRRRITWSAVDEDGRSELLAVVPQAPAEYPEEITKRVVCFLHRLQLPRRPECLVHLCNESFGASHLARGLLKKRQQATERLGFAPSSATGSEVKLALIGGCMTQQTLFLFQDVLDTLPSVSETLEKCMDVAAFVTNSIAMQDELERLNSDDHQLSLHLLSPRADDFHSFTVCVHQVLRLKDLLCSTIEENAESGGELELKPHLMPENTTATVAGNRAARAFAGAVGDESFWLDMNLVSQVLQPFAYASWLTECDHATSSAQLLLCWLLLLAVVRLTPRVLDTEKENFHMRVVDRIRVFSEDHVIACLVLDPRVHGLGLSAPGKRRTRLIVGDLGERLIGLLHHASEGPPRLPFLDRSRLVEQLLQYLNRQRPFDDDEAWENMTSTTVAPRLFWLEYAKEAPELTQVALGVLGYRPFVAPLEATWHLSTQRFRAQQDETVAIASDFKLDGDANTHSTPPAADKLVPPVELIRFHNEQMRARLGSDEDERRRIAKYHATSMPAGPVLPFAISSLPTDQYTFTALSDQGTMAGPAQQVSPSSGDAAAAFRQLKSCLQRLDEHEKNLPVEDADASLQRFDADWLELGPNTPQQICSCLDRFLVGNYALRRQDGENDNVHEDLRTEANLVSDAEHAYMGVPVAAIAHTHSLSL